MAKIMVVDDERDMLELLNFVLGKDGHDVFTAYNGRDALEQLGLLPSPQAVVRPDMIILDVMMPEIDGYTVQGKLAESDDTRHIPVVILTAKGQMRDLFGLASNVVSYMEKPFDPIALRTKIKELLKS